MKTRYFIRLFVNVKNSLSDAVCEKDFWVHVNQTQPEINNSLKMEVGIEDTLHIEFEYNKSKYVFSPSSPHWVTTSLLRV